MLSEVLPSVEDGGDGDGGGNSYCAPCVELSEEDELRRLDGMPPANPSLQQPADDDAAAATTASCRERTHPAAEVMPAAAALRNFAYQQQQQQAERMQHQSARTAGVEVALPIGAVCMIEIEQVNRGASDFQRFPAMVVEVRKHDNMPTGNYTMLAASGLITRAINRTSLSHVPNFTPAAFEGLAEMHAQYVFNPASVPQLSTIAHASARQNVLGGAVGVGRCNCRVGRCNNKTCSCVKAGVLCGSTCHFGDHSRCCNSAPL